ncbi:MAG TPA: TIGR03013 family XrtA/PEP-CTERM system glycosyltransferase [Burkholderiaceae bacterium]|nr:TIGR03013 family XrtA/PEP-CTERM system glycosyltransferase [Burkholderiaceae bacterium]
MFRVFPSKASSAAVYEALLDGIVSFAALLAAAVTLGMVPGLAEVVSDTREMTIALGFAVVMALFQSFVGVYRHRLALLPLTLRISVVVVLTGYGTYLALKQFQLHPHPGPLVATAVAYFLIAFFVLRGAATAWRGVTGVPRVLIVGTGSEAQGVLSDLRADDRHMRDVVGFFRTALDDENLVDGAPIFERSRPLTDIVSTYGVDEIVVAVREQRGGVMPMDQLLTCRTRGIKILDLAAFYERSHAEVPVDSLKASWLVYGDGFVQGPARRVAKRLFDVVSSLLLLAIGTPVMLLAALAVKLDSRGPVFYCQERVGLGGRSFRCVKFRSMSVDAESDGVARWAVKNDSRVTRVGAFLRKTRIDELPQLFSVLKGEMSIVGPRPERPEFVAKLRSQIPFYDLRHGVKPGVTGWAQVRYSYGASIEDARKKHQFDLYYLKNNTLLLDLQILIETVTVVLFREGAQ